MSECVSARHICTSMRGNKEEEEEGGVGPKPKVDDGMTTMWYLLSSTCLVSLTTGTWEDVKTSFV